MIHRRAMALLVLALAVAAPVVLAQGTGRFVDTFDVAWQLILDTHFDPELNGVDWQAVRTELRPQAERAQSHRELLVVLQEMIARLGQSHFAILPRPGAETTLATLSDAAAASDVPGQPPARNDPNEASAAVDPEPPKVAEECPSALEERVRELLETGAGGLGGATPGFDVRVVDGAVLIVRVETAGPAAEAGLHSGLEVIRVGDLALTGLDACLPASLESHGMASSLAASLLGGAAGTVAEVEVETAAGERAVHRLERRDPDDATPVRFGNLPSLPVVLRRDWIEREERRIAYVRFNIWMVPVAPRFETAMESMRDADGFVLDLRGNPGGVAALAQGLAGYFMDERLSLGTMKSRRDSLELYINPRRVLRSGEPWQVYDGPLAILIDRMTASTSEIFAAGLQDHGRSRIFGEPSAGAALPAQARRLPTGDVLLHATGDFVRPSGGRVEGEPVVPDETVPLRRNDLAAGRDAALLAAVDWIVDRSDGRIE